MEIKDHSPSRRSKWNEFALAAHIKGHVALQGQLGRGMHNLEIDSALTKGVKGRAKAAENSLNKAGCWPAEIVQAKARKNSHVCIFIWLPKCRQ